MSNKNIYIVGDELVSAALKIALKAKEYTVCEVPHEPSQIASSDDSLSIENIVIIVYEYSNPKNFFESLSTTQNILINTPCLGVSLDRARLPLVNSIDYQRGNEDIPVLERFSFSAFSTLIPKVVLSTPRDIINNIVDYIESSKNTDVQMLRMMHTHALEVSWCYAMYKEFLHTVGHERVSDFSNTFLAPIATGYKLKGTSQKDYFETLKIQLVKSLTERNKDNKNSLRDHLLKFFPTCPNEHNCKPEATNLKTKTGPIYNKIYNNIKLFRTAILSEHNESNISISNEIYKDDKIRNAVLDLLYDCARIRSIAGFSEQIKGKEKEQYIDLNLPNGDYKIVVIDDHAEFWAPFFKQVTEFIIEKNKNVTIDVALSKDGISFCDNKGEPTNDHTLMSRIPDCDLIFIDVMLGGKSGLDILNKIRAVLPIIPIVIISTKNDTNMFNKIQRANAFVYKKNLQIETIAEMVVKFLSEGLSRRHNSLPNPFFNNNIINKDQDLREPLLNFTNFTIKHLDGFHGLDNHYFRYFNNHGGRHMIALMHILEHLLRPFLLSEDDELGLNTKIGKVGDEVVDIEKRKTIILSLYLAVLTHEFGMFPLGTGDARIGVNIGSIEKPILIEDYSKPAFTTEKVFKTDSRLKEHKFFQCMDVVRKFHGARSMMMLLFDREPHAENDSKQYDDGISKKDKHPLQYTEFRKIWNTILNNLDDEKSSLNISEYEHHPLKYLVAAIAGYHNRFLSLDDKHFLEKLTTENEQLLKVIDNTIISNLVNDENFKKAFEAIRSKLAVYDSHSNSKPIKFIDQFKKICAVFRFADSLDIDYSRAIPSYLGYPDDKNPWEEKGYTEDLKRYIVHHVDIDCGIVTVHFNLLNELSDSEPYFDRSAGKLRDIINEYIQVILDENFIERKDYSNVQEIIDKIDEEKNDNIDKIQKPLLSRVFYKDIKECIEFLNEHKDDIDLLEGFLALNENDKDLYTFKYFACYDDIQGDRRKMLEEITSFVFKRLLHQYCATSNKVILPALRTKIQSLLCALVMLELFDEYKAIVDVGLANKIQFGRFKFVDTPAVDFNLLDYMRERYRS